MTASARIRAFACYLQGRRPKEPQAQRYVDALVRSRRRDPDHDVGGKASTLWAIWATIASAAAVANVFSNRPRDALLWSLVTLGWLLAPARRALTRDRLRRLSSDDRSPQTKQYRQRRKRR